MNELLALDARAAIALPFRWVVATRWRSFDDPLRGELRWPLRGPRVVVAGIKRPFRDPGELEGLGAELVAAEVDSASELEELAEVTTRTGAAAVCFAGPDVPPELCAEIPFESPSMVVLPRSEEGLFARAGRLTEQLVRERVILRIQHHWRSLLSGYVGLGLEATEGRLRLAPVAARPPLAPLATLEHQHVAGVVGLWFEGEGKACESLEVSPGRLHRKLEELPPGIARALAPLPRLARARLLVLEDDPALAEAMADSFREAARGLRRKLEVTLATSAEEAIGLVERDGAPELLWADVRLDGKLTGVDFVRWLRQEKHATAVLGKTALPDEQAVASLHRLGALHVWTGAGLPSLPSALTSGLEVAAGAAAIRRDVVQAARRSGELAALLGRVLAGDAAGQRAEEARERLSALEADRADHPGGAGEAGWTLGAFRAEAVRLATGDDTLLVEAARTLGVDVKTLRHLLDEEGRSGG